MVFFDGIHLFDSVYRITEIQKDQVVCEKQETRLGNTDRCSVTLYQALPNKLEKLEYIIQKGVEVGVQTFIFFRSDRSQKLQLSDSKRSRLTKIMIEAVEQSGACVLPEIHFFDEFSFEQHISSHHIYLHTENLASKKLRDIARKEEQYSIWIGPEGGWSEKELQNFREKNMTPVYLGSQILRTETVGLVTAFFLLQR